MRIESAEQFAGTLGRAPRVRGYGESVEALVAEDEDGVAVHRPVDLGAERGARGLAEIDALHFGGKQRVQRGELQCHDGSSSVIY